MRVVIVGIKEKVQAVIYADGFFDEPLIGAHTIPGMTPILKSMMYGACMQGNCAIGFGESAHGL